MSLEDFSNPNIVYRRAKKVYGDDVDIKPSTKNGKKYMLYNPNTNKWVHFGAYGAEDYTVHNDEKRRRIFKARNHKWKDTDPYSPAFLSYHLLW
jgi:hypothetical protein